MNTYQVKSIGRIAATGNTACLRLDPEYIPALRALDGFSHINVIWWFSEFDTVETRSILEVPQPYKKAPAVMGIFATRAPVRPNPLALTTVRVLSVDVNEGVILVDEIDAHDGSPILDIKPYTPGADRVEHPGVPEWCRHWPESLEAAGSFDWNNEFNF